MTAGVLRKPRFFLILLFGMVSQALLTAQAVWASDHPEQAELRGAADEEERKVGLPVWEDGDFRDGFDVRIWPERTVRWLERENLRDLIADPSTPAAERKALKQVLASQQQWPRSFGPRPR